MTRGPEPVAVRLGRSGPVHLAFPISDAQLRSVCGGTFGHASVIPTERWRAPKTRRCEECEEAAMSKRGGVAAVLRMIAGL